MRFGNEVESKKSRTRKLEPLLGKPIIQAERTFSDELYITRKVLKGYL